MNLRHALPADLQPLRTIRNHYILSSHATFDEALLSEETVALWIKTFSPSGPYQLLVAEEAGRVLGFASSQQYRTHPAFRKTVETSIYVAPSQASGGIGSSLYTGLFSAITNEGLHKAVAGIAMPNEASVRLHKKFGFTEVGTFTEYAVKNGQYVSSLWMQRCL